jgi:hypothetical protein
MSVELELNNVIKGGVPGDPDEALASPVAVLVGSLKSRAPPPLALPEKVTPLLNLL